MASPGHSSPGIGRRRTNPTSGRPRPLPSRRTSLGPQARSHSAAAAWTSVRPARSTLRCPHEK
eukprot:3908283-Alexandrium_andersonii.AAC.1